MVEKKVKVTLEDGLESRQAAMFVQVANKYASRIYIIMEDKQVNAKSIMGIMAFNPSKGMTVNIVADGRDEEEALVAMEKFLVCQ